MSLSRLIGFLFNTQRQKFGLLVGRIASKSNHGEDLGDLQGVVHLDDRLRRFSMLLGMNHELEEDSGVAHS
jgi:hypothetical protein